MLMEEMGPKVSIIIPVYNGSNYLREAIDSALSQIYGNCEVIVVNDGSDDGGRSEQIALSYGSRIIYIAKPNGGVASALNAGIAAMSGDFFSWLSHDDVYDKAKIRVQMEQMRNEKCSAILYSDYEYIDARSKVTGIRRIAAVEPGCMRLALLTGDPVNGCTTLIPRKCFDAVGLFDERLRTIQDYDLWFRLARKYRFVHIPHSLLKSRVHPEQGINTIQGHHDECQEFFMRAFSELSEEEISEITGLPLSVFYARSAVRMKIRGFTGVAAHLLDLSRKYAADADLAARLQRKALSVVCNSLSRKFKPAYWIKRIRNGSPV